MPTLAPGTWLLLSLAAVAAVGAIVLVRSVARLASDLVFTTQYRERVHVLVEHADGAVYEWLTLNVNRMQVQMGPQGLITFRPPFANHVIQNYPVVLNVLPELRRCLSDQLLSRNLLGQYHALLDDALLRHQGSLTGRHQQAVASAKNPIAWLTAGVRTLLAAPVWFLATVGVISRSFASRVVASSFYRLLAGLVATVGFVSAVVGLVTGWEQFAAILRRFVPGAF
ncbi:MAG: hypothetical protein ABFC67_00020 [Mizugakiibacter sp.]|uniref:hypothetical protein n=1 Tax=Mizugakiibacter sp. TaxID=1972610 RepID=UPI0031BDA204|nr:hypothetical protein [Xanthomonadaceae bacterium]